MDRIRRSIALTKASLGVLRSDKELLVFPFLSFLALIVLLAIFAVPFIGITAGARFSDGEGASPVVIALFFAFYLLAHIVAFFFNTALIAAAQIRLAGGDPSVRDGLAVAVKRLPAIVMYAVIAATIGYVLRSIAQRAGLLGSLVVGAVGFSWSIATFLVMPVLAAEGVGPIAAIKRSASLLRQTWGEQLVGNIGIGIVFSLIFIVGIIGGGLLIGAAAAVSTTLLIVAVIAVVLILGVIGLIAAAVSGIYAASVYRYATTGNAGLGFSSETLAGTFTPTGSPPTSYNPPPPAGPPPPYSPPPYGPPPG